jgi:hypothetical protein
MAEDQKPEDHQPGADPAKDRFRQALERKRSAQHASNEARADTSKVSGEHARAGGKRTFRRKSG